MARMKDAAEQMTVKLCEAELHCNREKTAAAAGVNLRNITAKTNSEP